MKKFVMAIMIIFGLSGYATATPITLTAGVSPLPNGSQVFTLGPVYAPLPENDGVFSIQARGDFFMPGDDIGEYIDWNINNYFSQDIRWSAGLAENEYQIGTASTLDTLVVREIEEVWTTRPEDDIEWLRSIKIPKEILTDIISSGPLSVTITLAYPKNVSLNQYIPESYINYSLAYEPPIPNPEPTTMLLFGSGLIGLAGFRRKFKKD